LYASLLDGLATPFADAVGAVVDALERTFDLVQKVADVLLDRQVLLAFEGGRTGVGGLIVQADVTGHLGLGGGEGVLFEGCGPGPSGGGGGGGVPLGGGRLGSATPPAPRRGGSGDR